MSGSITINLNSWIIQDGNYGDFTTGGDEAFAVEFWAAEPLRSGGGDQCGMTWVKGSTYDVVADVCFMSDKWWALDIGPIKVFCELLPQDDFKLGQRVSGRIGLGVDPFTYRASLNSASGAPALIYDWRIKAIQRDDTPWIEASPRMWERDRTRQAWTTVSRTNAWEDDNGWADYVLICERVAGEPRWSPR